MKGQGHGRQVKGKRGIGSGKSSHATSTRNPGSPGKGFKMTQGNGLGGKVGSKGPGKGKNSKSMGGY